MKPTLLLYVSAFLLGVAQVESRKRAVARCLTASGEWDLKQVERHVMRSMGVGVMVAWLMLIAIVDATFHVAVTLVMAGAFASLVVAPKRRVLERRVVTVPEAQLEIKAIRRAGNDAMFWGVIIPMMTGFGVAFTAKTSGFDPWILLMVGTAAGTHWLKERANNYKNVVQLFMTEDGGLNQGLTDLDDMRKDGSLAPSAVKHLLPILSVMEDLARWISKKASW